MGAFYSMTHNLTTICSWILSSLRMSIKNISVTLAGEVGAKYSGEEKVEGFGGFGGARRHQPMRYY